MSISFTTTSTARSLGLGAKKLFVVGDGPTTQLFELVGAVGIVVERRVQAARAVQYLTAHKENIGGIVVAAAVAGRHPEFIERLRVLDVPVLQLPAAATNPGASAEAQPPSQTQLLEQLMERALGMKLERKLSA